MSKSLFEKGIEESRSRQGIDKMDSAGPELEAEIRRLHELLNSIKYPLKIKESERLYLSKGNVEFPTSFDPVQDQNALSRMTHVNLNADTIVKYHSIGVTVNFMKASDRVAVYDNMLAYIETWIKWTQYNPERPCPPIADFIAIDDYLSDQHLEVGWIKADQAYKKTLLGGPVKKPVGLFESSGFSTKTVVREVREEPSGTIVMPYESRISKFPNHVWV